MVAQWKIINENYKNLEGKHTIFTLYITRYSNSFQYDTIRYDRSHFERTMLLVAAATCCTYIRIIIIIIIISIFITP